MFTHHYTRTIVRKGNFRTYFLTRLESRVITPETTRLWHTKIIAEFFPYFTQVKPLLNGVIDRYSKSSDHMGMRNPLPFSFAKFIFHE
ncbi:hypothetical protein CDES_08760 [Corynebacterium deserti GIMN1.010]|uniref:Uncharacterized protein n=1 Tax=Corynebacterium deserti GIMN1.010 TaxID=931089 RepID=A0A0M5IGA4_9CORY|nr:hypothetical protein CDES_08760 [Corynebacterium deserti GIMN1.010]